VLFWGVMVDQFKVNSLTSRQRAHIEEQRLRGVSAAFARLEKALENTARPVRGPRMDDRLAYHQAKFDRRVSDPGSRHAAAELISGNGGDGRRRGAEALLTRASHGKTQECQDGTDVQR
jgi:hypothetical protein